MNSKYRLPLHISLGKFRLFLDFTFISRIGFNGDRKLSGGNEAGVSLLHGDGDNGGDKLMVLK